MTIRHIRIFEAVCAEGCNTTRAAEKLHMTQPAVSLAIREMESYYGVQLFDRISHRLYLSEAGREFRTYARTILHTFDDMEKTVRDWDETGSIRVGASVSIGSRLLPACVAEFRTRRPEIRVEVRIHRSDSLEQAVLDNKLDLALLEGMVHDPNLKTEDYMEDSLALLAAPDMYPNGTVLQPDTFLRLDFLLREHGSGTREVFEHVLEAASCPRPEPVWESISTEALIRAAAAGLGVAVVPHRMAREQIASGFVSEIRVEGMSFRRTYKIVFHKDKKLTRAAEDFLSVCRSQAEHRAEA